jgi:hypothetical protein
MRLEAALWYQQRKPGLGEEFVKEVDQAIRRVREIPSPFALFVAGVRYGPEGLFFEGAGLKQAIGSYSLTLSSA